MVLFSMLHKLGERLGIIELAHHDSPSAPVKIKTRTMTLAELTTHIQVGDLRELVELPSELLVSFDEIFKTAGIPTSSDGWSFERLQKFLSHDRFQKMDRASVQQETLKTLATENVDVKDLVKDAVARDQALDAFQELIVRKRQVNQAALAHRLAELDAQRKELEREAAEEEKRWKEWRDEKRKLEQELARVVHFLIDQSVISIDNDPTL